MGSTLKQTNQALIESMAEVKRLQTALDESLIQINNLNKELEDTNRGVLALYKELDDKNIELTDKNEQLQRSQELSMQAQSATKAKSRFLAQMSHEIRNQMNAIIGLGDVLSRSPLNAEQSAYIDLLRDSSHALLAIINDVLDFSKIEAGKLALETMEFDLSQTIEQTAKLLNNQAKEKNLSLVTVVAPEIPRVLHGDPGRLRQILINLIGNAIKFTEAGEVALRVIQQSKDEERVIIHFSISDTGMGIPEDLHNRLFQTFTQLPHLETDKQHGTGLGLSICKKLVEQMGGEIGAQNRKGKGATFWFALPFKYQNAGAQPIDQTKMPNRTCPDGPSLLSGHVLLVEDNPTNQMVATMQLKELGLRADVATDGRQAIEAIAKENYALILMDCQLPGMDGYEATRQIRKMEAINGHHVPIVAITAHAMLGSKGECLAAGMDDYICKPISLEDLRAVLERWLSPQPTIPVQSAKDKMATSSNTTSSTNAPLAPKETLVDLQYLQQRFEQDQLRAIFNSFVNETVPVLNNILTAIEAQDEKNVAALAHRLKGSSATVTANIMANLAKHLEETAKQLDWQTAKHVHQTLTKSFSELKGFLRDSRIIESLDV